MALGFVVIAGIEIDGAKRLENTELFAAFHVFGKGGSDRFFLGFVAAGAAGFLDQTVIQGQVGGHV